MPSQSLNEKRQSITRNCMHGGTCGCTIMRRLRGDKMVRNFELMEIHRVRKSDGHHDFEADLPGLDNYDMVDSNGLCVGTARDVIKYLLKYELKGYKLVKKVKKS